MTKAAERWVWRGARLAALSPAKFQCGRVARGEIGGVAVCLLICLVVFLRQRALAL
jgi:hypothetical protein